MQDKVHTSRIPGLTTAKNGTLLAIYDARYESDGICKGDIDIALNRSTDGGVTWQPIPMIATKKHGVDYPKSLTV